MKLREIIKEDKDEILKIYAEYINAEPNKYSTQTTYLVIDDKEIVGILNARWEKVSTLMLFGGLIGYSIRPKYRGKGYANEMLKLGLEKF